MKFIQTSGLAFWKKAELGAREQRWMAEMLMFNYTIKHGSMGQMKMISRFATGNAIQTGLGLLNLVTKEAQKKNGSY